MTTLADIESLLDVSTDGVDRATTLDELAGAERSLTGRGSPMARANEAIKELEPGDRPAAGRAVGAFKTRVAERVDAKRAELETAVAAAAPDASAVRRIVPTLPGSASATPTSTSPSRARSSADASRIGATASTGWGVTVEPSFSSTPSFRSRLGTRAASTRARNPANATSAFVAK